MKFGTGFCLDPNCRFVGTDYLVAKAMGMYVRINGVLSVHRYLDSDLGDLGVPRNNLTSAGPLKYTPTHNLAIYEMHHPINGFHGISFDTRDLEANSEADIYAYSYYHNPKRTLACWHTKFVGKTLQGLLAFRYEEGRERGGASGGIVVDTTRNKIVGILSGMVEGKDRIALAVPVKELSDFVGRVQPYLQSALFPTTVLISPIGEDLYPPYVWPRPQKFSQRPVNTPAVISLRRTAQDLADSMQNFTAIETFVWGRDDDEEAADAYETLILGGSQRWRRPGGKKFYNGVPPPPLNGWLVSGGEWSELPQMVGTALDLKIHQAPDATVGGRTVHVFQYGANSEDSVCRFRFVNMFRDKTSSYDCHGEVWTDEVGLILRISETFDLLGSLRHYRGVVTYGWLEKDGKRYLVPVTIATQVDHPKDWCRGLFTDYVMFGVKTRLVLPTSPEQERESAHGAH